MPPNSRDEGNDIVTEHPQPAGLPGVDASVNPDGAPVAIGGAVAEPGASGVEAVGVTHHYDGQGVLHELSLAVEQGTFCTLLGPSGSGKTTLLRIFAGLLTPSQGRIRISGRDVTDVAVQQRSIGFVFQHYALFPHLTVADNIAYPLKVRGYGRSERKRMVDEMIAFADLGGLARRHPGQLSGGQQQRVAIARALVFQPEVLLLDEPLGALDRRLRQQLGAELRRIQKETATTAIYVTHDQEEALLLSDTVAVMDGGVIRQMGAPVDLYARPADRFVATFLGDTNLLSGTVDAVLPSGARMVCQGVTIECTGGAGSPVGEQRWLSVRPEDVEVLAAEASSDLAAPSGWHEVLGPAVVTDCVFLGGRFRARLRLADGAELVAELPGAAPVPAVGDDVLIGWRRGSPVVIGD